MLVITRKETEKLTITVPEGVSGTIELSVIWIDRSRGQVRLGIEAPREIAIHRNELLPLVMEDDKRQRELADTPYKPRQLRIIDDASLLSEFESKLHRIADVPPDPFSEGLIDIAPDPKDTL